MNFEDYHAIYNLVNRYAQCADKGDFEGVAQLYAKCVIYLPSGEVIDVQRDGVSSYLKWYRDLIRLYPDSGTPKTRRLMGTIIIEDDGHNEARAESNVICFQATPKLPLQAIIAGTLYDRYHKIGSQWHIMERREDLDLVGDMSHHLLPSSNI